MIEFGGVASSICANNLILKSGLSGAFSCTQSACASARLISGLNASRSREAPGERRDLRQQWPRIIDILAQVRFRLRSRISRNHIESASEIVRGPTCADHPGTDDRDSMHRLIQGHFGNSPSVTGTRILRNATRDRYPLYGGRWANQ